MTPTPAYHLHEQGSYDAAGAAGFSPAYQQQAVGWGHGGVSMPATCDCYLPTEPPATAAPLQTLVTRSEVQELGELLALLGV